ncbi:hypothetical protein KKF86_08690 [bacterium]|nr:hypothetical protein [bacterium]
MAINFVLIVVFGLALVVIPKRFLLSYSNLLDTPMEYIGQLFGAAFIRLAVLTWLSCIFI